MFLVFPTDLGNLQGVEFWAVNTDAQALDNSLAPNKVQMGNELTRGLGRPPRQLLHPSCAITFECRKQPAFQAPPGLIRLDY